LVDFPAISATFGKRNIWKRRLTCFSLFSETIRVCLWYD